MKKIMIAIVLLFISLSLLAKSKENLNYVRVDGKTYFGSEIRTGIFKTKLVTTEGQKEKFANQKIETMMNKGHLYEKLPVICKNKAIASMAMMEYIAGRDGFRLYRYNCYNPQSGIEQSIVDKDHPESVYYVFEDGKFHLSVNESNAEITLSFFGIKVTS